MIILKCEYLFLSDKSLGCLLPVIYLGKQYKYLVNTLEKGPCLLGYFQERRLCWKSVPPRPAAWKEALTIMGLGDLCWKMAVCVGYHGKRFLY